MRRPLCYICMAFVVTVFIYLELCGLPSVSLDQEGSRASYLGEVTYKEYKNGKLILHLKHICKSDESVANAAYEQEYDKEGILCYVNEQSKEPKLGSQVLVEGETAGFEPARNPGGFDRQQYYLTLGLAFSLQDTVILAESEQYSVYREGLYRLRRTLEGILEQSMEEKDASVMKAVLLGNKSELDPQSKELYQKSGISHILAISGLHISLLGMGLYELLKKLRCPRQLGAVAAILLMLAYGDMCGMSSSAYRAIFMFGMKMGAELLHRTYDVLTALAVSAVTILLEQPLYLYYAGFQLSYGAILGIACMLPVMQQGRQSGKARTAKVTDALLGSVSIFMIQFPMMLCTYYEFPVYSFLLNLIVIPAMGLLMGLGLVTVALGAVFLTAAQITGAGCHLILWAFETLCEASLALPGASWIVGRPQTWQIVVYYLVMLLLFLIGSVLKYGYENRIGMPCQLKLLWLAAAVLVITNRTYPALKITMLDVGQGDSIWIETDTGHHYLIDGGSTSQSKVGKYTLTPFLKYTGTDTLEAVFLTHLDEDHISGVMELLQEEESIAIRQILIARAVIQDESYERLVEVCEERGIPIGMLAAGDTLQDGALTMTLLHPDSTYQAVDRNAYSLVMKLEYGEFHALFTGDVGEDGEAAAAQLLSDWDCTLYKTAHHGSKYSNTLTLLEQIRPAFSVISCGRNNRYGHPHEETLARFASVESQVLVTKDTGAIMIEAKKQELRVETYIK